MENENNIFLMSVDMSRIDGDICAWIVYKDTEIVESGTFRRQQYEDQNKKIIEAISHKFGIDYKPIKKDQ